MAYALEIPHRSCFNPPPAVRPGETCRSRAVDSGSASFNPPPAVRPGETRSESL